MQSKDCIEPKNLAINSLSCEALEVNWAGNKDQTYIVEAYAATDSVTALKVSAPICDNNNCTVDIEVTSGAVINWSVQAICNVQGVTLYSTPVNGPEATIPACNNVKSFDNSTGLQVYPNPSKGVLNVIYNGAIESNLQIAVFDVNGKQVFIKRVGAASKTSNQYQLDLHALTPGTYVLQTNNNSITRQAKFVLMKE